MNDLPTDIVKMRERLRLDHHGMALMLGVSTRMVLQWERGITKPPRIVKRCLVMLGFFHRELPGKFALYLQMKRMIPKRGRPVGSINVPEWMRPPKTKPVYKPTGKPRGRPRARGSERPVRRICRQCHKPGVMGGYFCDSACQSAYHNDLLMLQASAVIQVNKVRASAAPVAPIPAPTIVIPPGHRACRSPGCLNTYTGIGGVCPDCRKAAGLPPIRDPEDD